MKDFSIIIAHRGDPIGLWATIHSCEIELANSGYDYEYCLCVNGEENAGKQRASKQSPTHKDLLHTLHFLSKAGKLGHLKVLQRSVSPPTARQFATEKAQGKYLFFFDNHCLVTKDYFKRALHDFDRYGMDMLHSTTRYYSGEYDHYHYKLSLAKNFWATASFVPEDHVRPYRIAAAGHGGFAVRADVWREVGGYWEGFNGYGGEEIYFDLKMAMLGKTNWIDPKLVHYHYAGTRPYARHYTDDYYRNMMMCAHLIGGEDWLWKVGHSFITAFPIHKTPHYELMTQAYHRSKQHADELAAIRLRTLDEQLEDFCTQCIAY